MEMSAEDVEKTHLVDAGAKSSLFFCHTFLLHGKHLRAGFMLGGVWIKQVEAGRKVNCFEMGCRLDLVPAIASAGFREGF